MVTVMPRKIRARGTAECVRVLIAGEAMTWIDERRIDERDSPGVATGCRDGCGDTAYDTRYQTRYRGVTL